MIHTLELSKMISLETYNAVISLLHMRWFKRCYISNAYAEKGIPLIRLYKIKNKLYKGNGQQNENNDLMYLYMISISVNTGDMFGGSPHLSNNILSFTPDFVKAIYYKIYDLIPCLEQGVNHYDRGSKIWMEINSFKIARIDFAFDIKTMQQHYLTLINRGYGLRTNAYTRNYYDDKKRDSIISDDEPDIPDMEEFDESFRADVNYVYFKGNGANINIYHKETEIIKEQLAHDSDTDYDYLRLEVQVKRNKLNYIVDKFGLKGRELQYLATPEVENYILNSYVKSLTGTGIYVTYEKAMKIIEDCPYYKTSKKKRLQAVIKAVSDKHGIAKVLEQIENGTITDLGKIATVKQYLREIHKMGINPVTLSFRMNVPKSNLLNLTGGNDLQEQVLPSLVDIIKTYSENIRDEQEHGIPVTKELLEQIDKI